MPFFISNDLTELSSDDELDTIYLVPIGEFDDTLIDNLIEYCKVFFLGLKVKKMEPLTIVERENKLHIPLTLNITQRRKGDTEFNLPYRVAHPYDIDKLSREDVRQLSVIPLLNLLAKIAPKDSCAVLGLTMEDLFEGSNLQPISHTDLFPQEKRIHLL